MASKTSRFAVYARTTGGNYLIRGATGLRWAKTRSNLATFSSQRTARRYASRFGGSVVAV